MKKWIAGFLLCFLFVWCDQTVQAAEPGDVVVALGADLSASQRAEVLSLMGLTEESLSGCTVILITNQMEHMYLDAYLDSSVIGSRALSSVKLTKTEPGSGVYVTTQNINYCTTGMYRNALLTAGLEDTEVFVAGPSPISGTAALIGAVKAYEAISGEAVGDNVLDTSLDEMITTGELAESLQGEAGSEEVEALIAWLKAKIAEGELDIGDEQSVRDAIEEGEKTFSITLSEEDIARIIALLKKLDELGLDANYLIEQAGSLYEKYGLSIVENANEAINEVVENAFFATVKNVWQDIKTSVTNFFKNLFS